ncbi:MAG: hypothetical protein RIE08_17775 [Acidimicrobiales bacterium]
MLFDTGGTVVDMADLFGARAGGPSPELRRAIATLRNGGAEPPDWLLEAILDRIDAAERGFLPPMGRIAAYAGGLAAGAAGALMIANRARIRHTGS